MAPRSRSASRSRSTRRRGGKKAAPLGVLTRSEAAVLRNVFDTIDVDNSGALDISEMHKALVALGVNRSVAEIKNMFDEADTDGDQAISFDEFCGVVRNPKNRSLWAMVGSNVRDASHGILGRLVHVRDSIERVASKTLQPVQQHVSDEAHAEFVALRTKHKDHSALQNHGGHTLVPATACGRLTARFAVVLMYAALLSAILGVAIASAVQFGFMQIHEVTSLHRVELDIAVPSLATIAAFLTSGALFDGTACTWVGDHFSNLSPALQVLWGSLVLFGAIFAFGPLVGGCYSRGKTTKYWMLGMTLVDAETHRPAGLVRTLSKDLISNALASTLIADVANGVSTFFGGVYHQSLVDRLLNVHVVCDHRTFHEDDVELEE